MVVIYLFSIYFYLFFFKAMWLWPQLAGYYKPQAGALGRSTTARRRSVHETASSKLGEPLLYSLLL